MSTTDIQCQEHKPKNRIIMDFFLEATRRRDNGQIPSEKTINKIESYISSYLEQINRNPPCSVERWSNANLFERLAIVIVLEAFGDSVDGKHGEFYSWLDQGVRMKELYEYVKHYANKTAWKVYEIGEFEEEDFFGEYEAGMCRYKALQKNWSDTSWNEEELMPICMKNMFALLKDTNDSINWDRYEYWTNYTVANIVQNKEPSNSTKIKDTDETYMGIELKSPGHKKLCERLFDMGYMFFFEAPCKLQADTKHYRRMDLIVVSNNRAVIVEIDGGTHRTKDQQKDDYERDRLVRKNWTNTIRLEHGDAFYKTEECIEKIISALDPTRGMIS